MDFLEQYKQQNPELSRAEKRPQTTDEYGSEQSGLVGLVVRLSGGRIRDARRANYVLLAIGCVIILVLLLLIFGIPGSSPPTTPLLRQAHPDIISR